MGLHTSGRPFPRPQTAAALLLAAVLLHLCAATLCAAVSEVSHSETSVNGDSGASTAASAPGVVTADASVGAAPPCGGQVRLPQCFCSVFGCCVRRFLAGFGVGGCRNAVPRPSPHSSTSCCRQLLGVVCGAVLSAQCGVVGSVCECVCGMWSCAH